MAGLGRPLRRETLNGMAETKRFMTGADADVRKTPPTRRWRVGAMHLARLSKVEARRSQAANLDFGKSGCLPAGRRLMGRPGFSTTPSPRSRGASSPRLPQLTVGMPAVALVASVADAAPLIANVVIIFSDDLGLSDAGCHSAKGIATPNPIAWRRRVREDLGDSLTNREGTGVRAAGRLAAEGR
jgi:hypothetical protein